MSGRSWSRLALNIADEKGTKAYPAVENADYQTHQMKTKPGTTWKEKSAISGAEDVFIRSIDPCSVLTSCGHLCE
jgi:hypothetical protein